MPVWSSRFVSDQYQLCGHWGSSYSPERFAEWEAGGVRSLPPVAVYLPMELAGQEEGREESGEDKVSPAKRAASISSTCVYEEG